VIYIPVDDYTVAIKAFRINLAQCRSLGQRIIYVNG
jgi:hypothetical protein